MPLHRSLGNASCQWRKQATSHTKRGRVEAKNRAILDAAILVAKETDAGAVLLAAGLPEEARHLRQALTPDRRVIAASRREESVSTLRESDLIDLPAVRLRRRGRAKVALLEGLAAGLLRPGERVIVISGNDVAGESTLDTVAVVDLTHDDELVDGQADAPMAGLSEIADPAAFDALLSLCVQLGHEGREGRRVGILATLGDHEAVRASSRSIVLNPFQGHPETDLSVLNPAARRAISEFSGMDGAFVLRGDGVILAAGRYLEEIAPRHAVPSGLGARHRAAAGITAATRCIAFTVSESTGDTRVFTGGHLVMTIERTD